MSWTASAALKISSQTFLPELFAESLSTGNTLCVWESASPQKSDLSPSSFCTFPSKTPKGSHLPVGRCKYPRVCTRENAVGLTYVCQADGGHGTVLWQDHGLSLEMAFLTLCLCQRAAHCSLCYSPSCRCYLLNEESSLCCWQHWV